MRAGAAQTNITPLVGTSLAGYFHDRKMVDVRDELHAKAIVMDDGDTQVAVVVCDIIAVPRETVLEARALASAACGIPEGNILIAATHTHTAASPAGLLGTPRADEYMDALPPKIADSIVRAARRLQPAKWGVAMGRETRLSFNRRFRMRDGSVQMNPGFNNPDAIEAVGPIDPDVPVLHLVNTETDANIALLANFALHYVGGAPGDVASADYFGMFGREVAKWLGDDPVVALANGFCGDINNVDVTTKPSRTGPWEHAEHVARLLAMNVLSLVEQMEYSDDGELRAACETVTIPLRPITDDMRSDARNILGDRSPHDPADGYSRDEVYARELLLLDEEPRAVTTETQVIALGDVAFVSMPGEMFVQFALDLGDASPFSPLFKIELANDYVGYVPTRKAFEEGSYETWFARSSKLAPEAGEILMDGARRLMASL
jgi:neutral ceramidase